MVKTSTLMYLFSNFEQSELVDISLLDRDLNAFHDTLEFIEKNTKKVPEEIVNDVIRFAKNYS